MSIAVIGAGNFGKNHVRTLHQLGVLGAVAELNPALREAAKHVCPEVRVVETHEPLLGDESITAVIIATPAHTHHRIAKDFLDAGKDVFVEKPMTLNVADAEDLQQSAEKHGRVLMVGHLLMYQPAVRCIHDFIKGGALGRVFTLHQERAKLGKARAVENALWSLGVHDVAVLLHLVEETPEHVSAFGHCGLHANIEDDIYVHLTFPSGIKATLHNSWLWPEDSRVLRVIGQKGMLVYHEKENTVTFFNKTIDASLHHTDDKEGTVLFQGAAKPLILELEHFLECVKGRIKPLSDAHNGIEVIRVLERAAAGN